ncbi:MAG: glycosyl transferase [Melioribacteraceae bacterium]|nr:MAG: glycosyl transferase [Melioribacteraceae bacterium]
MKVLFLLLSSGSYFINILNKLSEHRDIEIVAIIPAGKSENVGKGVHLADEKYKFDVHYLEEYKTWYGKTFFKGFMDVVNIERPDIIIFHWPHILALTFYPLLYFKLRRQHIKLASREIPFGVPTLKQGITFDLDNVIRDEDDPIKKPTFSLKLRMFLLTLARKFYYPKIDVHLNYADAAYEVLTSYGVDHNKIFVIYNSPDTEKLFSAKEKAAQMPPKLPENFDRIIHVGRLVKWKRVDLLIEAVKKLEKKYPNIELVVVGYGPEEENLKNQAKNLGIKDRVIFTGGIYDQSELARYMLDSSIYVLAGMGGLSINDAMAFGKPVIVSVCDGTEKKLVFEDLNGTFFEEGNLESLTSKIDFLLSDEELVKKMGENSAKIIKEKINMHTVVKGYLDAFRYVMGETGI